MNVFEAIELPERPIPDIHLVEKKAVPFRLHSFIAFSQRVFLHEFFLKRLPLTSSQPLFVHHSNRRESSKVLFIGPGLTGSSAPCLLGLPKASRSPVERTHLSEHSC